MAIGAAIGAVGGIFALKDRDMPIWEKALIGAGVGATGGLAGGLLSNVLSDVGANAVQNITNSLPAGNNPVSFTGGYEAGRTEAGWLRQAAEHARIEAETGVNQAGYIRDCIRYAEKAAKK